MYEFSGKLKSLALALMLIGAVGIGIGFFNGSSKTAEDAKEAIAHHDAEKATKEEAAKTAIQYGKHNSNGVKKKLKHDAHGEENAHHDAHAAEHKIEHALTQIHNRPWAAVFVAMFFFFMIALVIFVFYTMQIGASAGWSIVLFRVMEAMSVAIMPIGVLLLIFLGLSAMGMNHIFPWMHAEGDAVLEGKAMWLNIPGWMIRSVVYVIGYILFRKLIIKKNHEQDTASDYSSHEKAFKYTIFFLAFFLITETTLAWDWVMSLDPHWFSTLFGWYIFASAIVTSIAVIAMVTIYLKSKGYLEFVNDSHIHDLGKYMFGFSIFWAYLWFAQYMLIWYSNMPEETTYFMQRMQQYQFIFFAMVAMNLAFPFLILMDTTYKRKAAFVLTAGAFILVGHYIDFFVMIMPSTVGAYWHFGIPEIGAILFFLGLFIFCGFKNLEKRSLASKNNPYWTESEHYHY